MGTRVNASRSRNLLLNALPPHDYDGMRHKLEIITLAPKQVLHNPGEPSEYVYFPRGGFLSIAIVLKNGAMVEVATVGREGMAVPSPKGPGRAAATNTLVVVQGFSESCYRMSSDDFQHEVGRRPSFMELVTRYDDAFLGVVMQTTGCNAAHTVEQRLAKWLLLAEDRMEAAEFSLTQEFVAMMLGATRQTVTVVAGAIQRKGFITYHRGRVKIVDRAGLEGASCECYKVSARLLRTAVAPLAKSKGSRPK
jgi:CRP-like cAMP-binding protein